MTAPQRTQRAGEEPADTCRRLGWGPGTRIVGDEGYGPTVIEITAVGERRILAKTLSHNDVPEQRHREGSWVLCYRDWQRCDRSQRRDDLVPASSGSLTARAEKPTTEEP